MRGPTMTTPRPHRRFSPRRRHLHSRFDHQPRLYVIPETLRGEPSDGASWAVSINTGQVCLSLLPSKPSSVTTHFSLNRTHKPL